MVVRHEEGGSIAENDCLEDFPWMHDRRREAADTHFLDTDEAMFVVENECKEPLAVPHRDLVLQERIHVASAAQRHRFGGRVRIADQLDADTGGEG